MNIFKKLVLVTVLFFLLTSVSAFADNFKDMNRFMWTWSSLEAVVCEAAHAHSGNYVPVVDLDEAYATIEDMQNRISKIIAEIKTPEEMSAARKLADEFVKMQDKEEEVGRAVNKLLDRQEKFLQAHKE
ncbi:MAG: hypothetical protein WA705_21885 [Candidatus Ozemobacteraceae bacterium]